MIDTFYYNMTMEKTSKSNNIMYNLENLSFIAIDFETANTYQNSACSIGLVRFENGKETDSFYSLIHPAKMYFIQEWTDTIHHISYKDVRDKPYFPEIWDNCVTPFIKKTPDLPLVAHNASFDMGVIRGCCNYFGMELPDIKYFDSLKIARKVWHEFSNHRLTFLGEQFKIKYLAHDALEDSRTCGQIICKAAEKTGCSSVPELLSFLNLELSTLTL